MRLVPIGPELIETVAGWTAEKATAQWLDFGNGVQSLTPAALRIMTQRSLHYLRVFMPDAEDVPLGVVALANIDRNFRTATPWAVLGNKTYRFPDGRAPSTSVALSRLLTLGFTELGLRSIYAWVVDGNASSLRLVERINLRYVGRQRQCHWIEGRCYDRLLFDLLAEEHKELTQS
jgi:RimJ/RimL family protein N-acetyltransferase